jgi:hypothetical protein
VLAEDYVAENLGRVVDVTTHRNHRLHAFKGSNHVL